MIYEPGFVLRFSSAIKTSDLAGLTKNSVLATLLVTVCRRILPVRRIDPNELTNIPAPQRSPRRDLWDAMVVAAGKVAASKGQI